MEAIELHANGLRFAALASGPEDGPPVLLLHGFPETSHSWKPQLAALAAAGFRAVAPDLRGYGDTERRGPYDIATLVEDAAGLIRALGGRATLVGHDWGGACAWLVPQVHPELVERLAILNAPHPAVLSRELVRNPRQRRRSRYMFWFQLPWYAELAVTKDGARMVGAANRAMPPDVRDRAQRSMLQPGAASAALGYYRAMLRRPWIARRLARRGPIRCPVLILWGVRDRWLGRELVEPRKLAPFLAVRPELVELDAGHSVQNEAPGRVNQELLRFLGSRSQAP